MFIGCANIIHFFVNVVCSLAYGNVSFSAMV